MVVGQGLELLFRSGEWGGWGYGGIDGGTEECGGGGFSGERWTSEEQDGIGAFWLEGGQEPGLDSGPVVFGL